MLQGKTVLIVRTGTDALVILEHYMRCGDKVTVQQSPQYAHYTLTLPGLAGMTIKQHLERKGIKAISVSSPYLND